MSLRSIATEPGLAPMRMCEEGSTDRSVRERVQNEAVARPVLETVHDACRH